MGYAVGFSIDTTGDVKSIGVDEGTGKFVEFPAARIISDKDGFIIVPAWKVEGESLTKEIEMIHRRIQSLDDLVKSGEVDQHLYEKNIQQYQERLEKIRDSCNNFAAKINARIGELDAQEESINNFLLNLKIYHKSGEMDEGTYNAQSEYSNAMKARDAREREELTTIMSVLTSTYSSIGQKVTPAEEEAVAPVSIHANLGA